MAAIINSYLRLAHVRHPEHGCAIATLGIDVSRQEPPTRKAAQKAIEDFIERMTRFMPGESKSGRRDNFYVLFSSLVGAVTMARMISDPRMRERILQSNREVLLKTFANQAVTHS